MKKYSTFSFTSLLLWLIVLVLAVFFVFLVVNGIRNRKAAPAASQSPLIFVPNSTEATPVPTVNPTATPSATPRATLPSDVSKGDGKVPSYTDATPSGANTVTGTIPKTGPGEVMAGLLAVVSLAVFGFVRTQQIRMSQKRRSRGIDVA